MTWNRHLWYHLPNLNNSGVRRSFMLFRSSLDDGIYCGATLVLSGYVSYAVDCSLSIPQTIYGWSVQDAVWSLFLWRMHVSTFHRALTQKSLLLWTKILSYFCVCTAPPCCARRGIRIENFSVYFARAPAPNHKCAADANKQNIYSRVQLDLRQRKRQIWWPLWILNFVKANASWAQ